MRAIYLPRCRTTCQEGGPPPFFVDPVRFPTRGTARQASGIDLVPKIAYTKARDGTHLRTVSLFWAPSVSDDPAARQFFSRFIRLSTSPGSFKDQMMMNIEIDVRPVLPTVNVPTLVLHRSDERHSRRLVDDDRFDDLLREVTIADVARACMRSQHKYETEGNPGCDDSDWWAVQTWMQEE